MSKKAHFRGKYLSILAYNAVVIKSKNKISVKNDHIHFVGEVIIKDFLLRSGENKDNEKYSTDCKRLVQNL